MQKEQIVEQAALAHAEYPQYDGHWDGPEWFLVKFTRRVRTKSGVAFEPGDVSIARSPEDGDEYPTAYSLRNKIDTSVDWDHFVRLDGER